MCHNRRVKVETTARNEGCEDWTTVKRRPAFARSVLERGTTVPLLDIALESGAGAPALQILSAFWVPIKPNQS